MAAGCSVTADGGDVGGGVEGGVGGAAHAARGPVVEGFVAVLPAAFADTTGTEVDCFSKFFPGPVRHECDSTTKPGQQQIVY